LHGQEGINGLIPSQLSTLELQGLGEEEVVVKIHAASLNYRGLAIAKGAVGLSIREGVVPRSDGSGIVTAVGSSVKDFNPGDKVVTHLAPYMDEEEWPALKNIATGLGQVADGTLQEVGVFHESALVRMPSNSGFEQAATLTCSALTAWNALFGLNSKGVKKDDWVLVQGTGGVSVAALQVYDAASDSGDFLLTYFSSRVPQGAHVIATTSSETKAERLRHLGAKQVINYRNDHSWGEAARRLTPAARGFNHVVDVRGNGTLAQSLKAVRTDGVVIAAGILGSSPGGKDPLLIESLWNVCIVRGVLLGTRKQFRDMGRFIEEHDVQLAVDDVTFSLDQVQEAYRRLEEQRHFAK
jgi:NADPH:quinone reductase-like Zn-dependent oxidoreductase